MRIALACALAAGVAGLVSCGGTKLRGKAGTISELIATARDNGAQRCAPVELALAESHHDFAKQELSDGDYYRARSELRVAEKNAHEAIRKSPKLRCAPKIVVAEKPKPKPKKKLVIKIGDADGDGIMDDKDECVNDPEDKDGFQDTDGCPDKDNDNDGIADTVDKCPNVPEDKDGFEDDDGCPDNDNDNDGLADKVDQCPDKPEDKDGHKDDDGCPDCDNDGDGVLECPVAVDKCPNKPAKTPDGCPQKYKLIVVTKTKIELKQTVYFAFRKWAIKRRSYAMLNEVAQALKDNPHINVRIEGHTDSIGRFKTNKRLSQRRANSVRKYLMGRGVPSGRMISKGYGEAVPVADNRTKAGRDQNRRVEFVITSR